MEKFSLFLEMSDAKGFIRGIFAAPFDANPKLVFADWLDENGREKEGNFLRMCARYQQNGNKWPDEEMENSYNHLSADLERDLNSKNVQFTSNRIKNFKSSEYYQVTSRGIEFYTPGKGLVLVDVDKVPEDILEGMVYRIGQLSAPRGTSEERDAFQSGIISLNVGLIDGLSVRGIREVYSAIRLIFLSMRHDEKVVEDSFSPWLWIDIKDKIRILLEHLGGNYVGTLIRDLANVGINVKDLIIDLKVLLRELPNS